AGRALDRAWSVDYLPRWGRAAVIGSLLLVLGRESQWVAMTIRARSRERATLQAMLSDPRVSEVPARESYFVEFPQFNRLHRNNAYSHDEWLYTAFERVDAAEPRERWLRRALTSGEIRQVITPHEQARLPGLRDSLSELGFARVAQFGEF